ncbi:MAG TPA: SURF1 family protein [Pseudomonadales bacterium]|nr:SURF1 family protein [Pseudomonadales bacterium]
MNRYRFQPTWYISALALCTVLAMISLGIWQTHRAEFKEALKLRFTLRSQTELSNLSDLAQFGKDVADYPIRTAGTVDNSHVILLDNQVHEMRAGFDVLNVLTTQNGEHILINRGWVPLVNNNRTPLPAIAPIEGELTVHGRIYVPNPAQFLLREDNYSQYAWPLVIQKIEFDKLSAVLGTELKPFVIRLNPDASQPLLRDWQSNAMPAEKHRAYALQWFVMAAVVVGLYAKLNLKKLD